MVKVATLKEQARQYERDGDLDKALAIYGHILTHLEGTPAIKGQLPLYVKVGDLHLKQGDTDSAIGMYQRAAEHYAEHGSAKSVIALCLKILRVAPKHTTVYLTYARRLLEFDHVGAARDVLIDFAERASLVKPLESLQRLADRPEDEARPVLERMLAGVRNSGEAAAVEPEAAEEEAPSAAEAGPPGLEREVWPASSGEEEAITEAPPEEPREPLLPPEYGPAEPSPVTASGVSDIGAARDEAVSWGEEPEPPPSGEDLPWLSDETRPSAVGAEPPDSLHEPAVEHEGPPPAVPERRPFSSFAREAERRRSTSRIWIIGAVILIIVALGGAFVKLGVIPLDLGGIFGRDGGEQVPPGEAAGPGAPSTEQVPAVLPESLPGGTTDSAAPGDTTAVDSLPALELGDTLSGSALPDSSAVEAGPGAEVAGEPEPDREGPAAAGTIARPPPAPTARSAPAGPLPTGAALTAPVILVRGLVVDSATEFPSGDLVGVRVIHRLESGDPLILRAVPVGGGMADSATAGIPRVTTLRGDTAFGTVMFGGYLVNARGKIAASRLDSLLRQLIRFQPQD